MPQQAILDLPVIEFEDFRASPVALQQWCAENYGLAGIHPHPDAVFHFAASLWRYRDSQPLFGVAALSSLYLHALSSHIAAQRRVGALRASGAEAQQVREAEEDAQYARVDLADLGRLVGEFAAPALRLAQRDPEAAREHMRANVQAIGEEGWAEELESLSAALATPDTSRLDFSRPLADVLRQLEVQRDSLLRPLPGASGPAAARMQQELDEYREIANRASARLRDMETERRRLESMARSAADPLAGEIEGAGAELGEGLRELRERLASMEQRHGDQLAAARRELAALRAERDRLAEELLQVVSAGADAEHTQEELIERIEKADQERVEAAAAIENLSGRLATVTGEAGARAQEAESRRQRNEELERALDEMRRELVDSEKRLSQAQASAEALESQVTGRGSELEQALFESEARIAELESALLEAQGREERLAHAGEDRDVQVRRLEEKLAAQRRDADAISGQLAEAETLSQERAARMAELEREAERLRKEGAEAQRRVLSARGEVEDAKGAEQSARAESLRLSDLLKDERARVQQGQAALQGREQELAQAKGALALAQKQAAESAQLLAQSNTLREAREKEAARLQADLAASRKEADEHGTRAAVSARELAQLRADADERAKRLREGESELKNTRYDLEQATRRIQQAGSSDKEQREKLAALQGEQARLRQELVEAREDARAQAEAGADKLRKMEEKLALLQERVRNADTEKKALLETLTRSEQNRSAEKQELESVIERLRAESGERHKALLKAESEAEKLGKKLNESDSFVIARQREIERLQQRVQYLTGEIGMVADLRTRFENAADDARRNELASQISRKLDTLFAESGRPVHADRRTEKIVILHVKKDDQQISAEAEKPFVSTKPGENSNGGQASGAPGPEAQS
ncbi:MAG: hypothetical protein IT463_01880 [Planctomycetes bacterium]|nr:hypothetical protein [Planctomycetota bacterium]